MKQRRVSFANQTLETQNERVKKESNQPNIEQDKMEIEQKYKEKAWTSRIKAIKNMDTMDITLDHLREEEFVKIPEKQNAFVQGLVKHHVDSFNWFVERGINKLTQKLFVDFDLKTANGNKRIHVWFKEIKVSKPNTKGTKKFPYQCRIDGTCYRGELSAKIGWKVEGIEQETIDRSIGFVPIMIKSSKCHLINLTPSELIKKGEEEQEVGGYFIVNGYEKILRVLLVHKRNYPLAIKRGSWTKRVKGFSEYGLSTRCVTPDNSFVSTNILHIMTDDNMKLSFTWQKEDFYIDVMLIIMALSSKSMHEHMLDITRCENSDDKAFISFMFNAVNDMMKKTINHRLNTSHDALSEIGRHFRVVLSLPESYFDVEVGEWLLKKVVCIHLTDNEDKASYLKYKMRKLFYFYKGKCCEESIDSPMFQEVLLPGHSLNIILNDCLDQYLYFAKEEILKMKKEGDSLDIKLMTKAIGRVNEVTGSLEKLISGGKYTSRHNLGPLGSAGLSIAADRLNYVRFLSHFRSAHRGSFYAELRTTTPRKLRQECYGFLCPVHTPDGAPCGLLNHLTFSCEAVVYNGLENYKNLLRLLDPSYFVVRDFVLSRDMAKYLPVLFDGNHVGWIKEDMIAQACAMLREKKVKGEDLVPNNLEICHVPNMDCASILPGMYLFAAQGRLVRPVENFIFEMPEYLGMFEQVYLTLTYDKKECSLDGIIHSELTRFSMLSETACFTPFANFNQSCRNLFQCQMSKQTVGVPYLTERYRTDNKAHRLIHAQSPLVRSAAYDMLNMDDHPIGINAVVAVMSYTGYDMEDAIVINKSSYDKGLFSSLIFKIEQLDLRLLGKSKKEAYLEFSRNDNDPTLKGKLDKMGLPIKGTVVNLDDPLFCYKNRTTKEFKVVRYHSIETAVVDRVFYCCKIKETLVLVKIKLRIYRKPVIGDKLCNRHGQKGILSQIWPHNEMPYTSEGIVPDIIFNPHGFPSRMTISMMLELLAGKAAALNGTCYDSSPFKFDEDNYPMDFFGDELEKAGFNRFGKDIMYSGRTGEPLQCYIFTGIIYYQRLRHMVDDKWQVRSVGMVDSKTQQPVQGRSKGGGVRFGEMERDCLIAHGTSLLLMDRLLNCSDGTQIVICKKCGNIHSAVYSAPDPDDPVRDFRYKCSLCKGDDVAYINAPHVLRYLSHNLPEINFQFTTTDQ